MKIFTVALDHKQYAPLYCGCNEEVAQAVFKAAASVLKRFEKGTPLDLTVRQIPDSAGTCLLRNET